MSDEQKKANKARMAHYYIDQRKRMDVETASRRALAKGAQNGRNQVRQKE